MLNRQSAHRIHGLVKRKVREAIMNLVRPNQHELLTVQEVAERLKCSRALIYALCEKGRLNHHRLGLGRGTIRISVSDLEAFLQAARVEPQRLTTTVGLKHIRLPAAGSR